MKNTLMVIGAAASLVRPIKIARNMGSYVVAVNGNPHAPGMRYADRFENIDIVDKEGCLQLAREEAVTGVLPATNVFSQETVSFLCKSLNLPGVAQEQIDAVYNAAKFYTLLEKSGLNVPGWREVASVDKARAVAREMGYPVVLEPSEPICQHGCLKAVDDNDFLVKLADTLAFSRNDKVVIAKLLNGKPLGVHMFLINGKAAVEMVCDKVMSTSPNFFELGYQAPAAISVEEENRVKNDVLRVVRSLNYLNGPVEANVLFTAKGPYTLDMSFQLWESSVQSLLWVHTGIEATRLMVRWALGETPDSELAGRRPCCVYHLFPEREGVLKKINYPDELITNKNLLGMIFDARQGDMLKMNRGYPQKLGHVITIGDNAKTAYAKARDFARKIDFSINSDSESIQNSYAH